MRPLLPLVLILTAGAVPLAAQAIVPAAPADEAGRAAYSVLDRYCSGCHQAGRLDTKLSRPKADFGFVLDLDKLARTPKLVSPGNPDGSRLFALVADGSMPYDGDCQYPPNDGDPAHCPQTGDMEALRRWIDALKPPEPPRVAFVRDEALVRLVVADLQKLPPVRAKTTRYISLAELANAGTPSDALTVYRQAVAKLLNSLSRSSGIVRPEPIDEAKTILRFDIGDLGWSPEDWDHVTSLYPYATRPDAAETALLRPLAGTDVPMLRGDWLAFHAARPPLYDTLLDHPANVAELERRLGVDVARNIERGVARRGGFVHSGVSAHNRLIERHPGTGTAMFWTSYDFASDAGKQSLMDNPLGPGGPFGFEANGGETIYALPNGFQAYYLANAKGESLDTGPTNIVQDTSRVDHTVINGISCMSCHARGMNTNVDKVRAHVLGDDGSTPNLFFPREVREKVAALYPPAEAMAAIFEADAERYRRGLEAAGVDPALTLDGVEMVTALSNRYEAPVELALAGAELGLTAEALRERAGQVGGATGALVRRLDQQKSVPRDLFEAGFPTLVAALTGAEPIGVSKAASAPPTHAEVGFDLALTSDKSSYAIGEKPVFTIRAERSCFLTLIDLDQKGTATVLFPNRFQQDNRIAGGADVLFPDPAAPFEFTVGPENRGEETVIATCDVEEAEPVAVHHDFAAEPFTQVERYATKSLVVGKRAEPTRQAGEAPAANLGARVQTAIKIRVD